MDLLNFLGLYLKFLLLSSEALLKSEFLFLLLFKLLGHPELLPALLLKLVLRPEKFLLLLHSLLHSL
jgi:hypothetical protein